jgi:Arc/MetJ-type ribon-helix-helix transcriptional regulator
MTTKLAISLPDDMVAAARQAVSDGRASSVSAYIAEALADHVRHDELTDLLAEMAAETGAPDANDRRWARSALGLD